MKIIKKYGRSKDRPLIFKFIIFALFLICKKRAAKEAKKRAVLSLYLCGLKYGKKHSLSEFSLAQKLLGTTCLTCEIKLVNFCKRYAHNLY